MANLEDERSRQRKQNMQSAPGKRKAGVFLSVKIITWMVSKFLSEFNIF